MHICTTSSSPSIVDVSQYLLFMVMREFCKVDDAIQWENGKFDPLPRPNPLTDRHKKITHVITSCK